GGRPRRRDRHREHVVPPRDAGRDGAAVHGERDAGGAQADFVGSIIAECGLRNADLNPSIDQSIRDPQSAIRNANASWRTSRERWRPEVRRDGRDGRKGGDGPGGQDGMTARTYKESFKVAANELVDAARKIVREGNVRRIIVKQ